jgi:TIGR00251 family protein
MVRLRESKNGLTFDIQVIPHASRAEIVGAQEGALKIKVTAPPVEGAANEACIKLLAKELGLKKSQMEISSGAKSRKKTVMIKDISKTELETKINNICKTN